MNSSYWKRQNKRRLKVLLAVTSGFSQSASLSFLLANTNSDISALVVASLEGTTGGNATAVWVATSVASAERVQCEFGSRRLLLEEFGSRRLGA